MWINWVKCNVTKMSRRRREFCAVKKVTFISCYLYCFYDEYEKISLLQEAAYAGSIAKIVGMCEKLPRGVGDGVAR